MDKDIEFFAAEMEATMNMHKPEKGDSWKTCSIEFLESKLREEFKECQNEYGLPGETHELVDLANICMMLHNRKIMDVRPKAKDMQFAIDLEILQQNGNKPFTTTVRYKIDGNITPEALKSAILAGIMKLTEMHKEFDNTIMVIDEQKK